MSDHSALPARPVSLFTLVFLFAVFAAGLLVIRYFYHPAVLSTVNAAPENLPKDLEWRATAAARRSVLTEVRESSEKAASSYAWIDQKAGAVRLPVDRAMELTAQRYSGRK